MAQLIQFHTTFTVVFRSTMKYINSGSHTTSVYLGRSTINYYTMTIRQYGKKNRNESNCLVTVFLPYSLTLINIRIHSYSYLLVHCKYRCEINCICLTLWIKITFAMKVVSTPAKWDGFYYKKLQHSRGIEMKQPTKSLATANLKEKLNNAY